MDGIDGGADYGGSARSALLSLSHIHRGGEREARPHSQSILAGQLVALLGPCELCR